jgi:hypothetical protein
METAYKYKYKYKYEVAPENGLSSFEVRDRDLDQGRRRFPARDLLYGPRDLDAELARAIEAAIHGPQANFVVVFDYPWNVPQGMVGGGDVLLSGRLVRMSEELGYLDYTIYASRSDDIVLEVTFSSVMDSPLHYAMQPHQVSQFAARTSGSIKDSGLTIAANIANCLLYGKCRR